MTTEKTPKEIKSITTQEIAAVDDSDVKRKFLERVRQGNITRDENKEDHVCVYFALFDPYKAEVFLGHHRKADLWLFSGGHMDKGETPFAAVFREMNEELGDIAHKCPLTIAELVTVTEINNTTQECKKHWDLWYFLQISSSVQFDQDKLAKEFHETGWFGVDEALKIVTNPGTIEAINFVKRKFYSTSGY